MCLYNLNPSGAILDRIIGGPDNLRSENLIMDSAGSPLIQKNLCFTSVTQNVPFYDCE